MMSINPNGHCCHSTPCASYSLLQIHFLNFLCSPQLIQHRMAKSLATPQLSLINLSHKNDYFQLLLLESTGEKGRTRWGKFAYYGPFFGDTDRQLDIHFYPSGHSCPSHDFNSVCFHCIPEAIWGFGGGYFSVFCKSNSKVY